MSKFAGLLEEGACYRIRNFGVGENGGKYPLLPHKYKINFFKNQCCKYRSWRPIYHWYIAYRWSTTTIFGISVKYIGHGQNRSKSAKIGPWRSRSGQNCFFLLNLMFPAIPKSGQRSRSGQRLFKKIKAGRNMFWKEEWIKDVPLEQEVWCWCLCCVFFFSDLGKKKTNLWCWCWVFLACNCIMNICGSVVFLIYIFGPWIFFLFFLFIFFI